MRVKDSGNKQGDSAMLDATVILAGNLKYEEKLTEVSNRNQIADICFTSRFEHICTFASGGMGQIAKAKDKMFDRIVAVKTLKDDFKDNPHIQDSFIEECHLNAKLDHPSIVPVYSMGKSEDGRWEVAMKFINGSSLNHFIASARECYDKGSRITSVQARRALISRLEYFLKFCEVIEYCHNLKIVHGDIKPDNIFMGQYGEVYIMDWGCAKTIGTVLERLNGTPAYLPPEFFENKTVTPLIDVYSLGIVLFEMTTLRRGRRASLLDVLPTSDTSYSNLNDKSDFRHYQAGIKIEPAIRAIINKAIELDPAKRYPSVQALANDVRHFIYEEEVSAAPDNLLQKISRFVYHHRIKSILGVILIFLLWGGSLFYSYYQENRNRELLADNMMRRMKLQAYTDVVATAVERRFLLSQAQLLLFADNIIEDTGETPDFNSVFYDNDAYKLPETSPAGMLKTEHYANPINLNHMVRIDTKPDAADKHRPLIGAGQFVDICNKIICYDLNSHNINDITARQRKLLTENNMIQRLFIKWADDTVFSYPGTYEDPKFIPIQKCWGELNTNSADNQRKKILWSAPYQGIVGTHRIVCSYPMFSRKGDFRGFAGIEIRLYKLLSPMLKANWMDPVHKLYFVDDKGNIATVDQGKVLILDNSEVSDGLTAQRIREIVIELKNNNMQQIQRKIKDKNYYISGGILKTVNAILLQMIDEESLKYHNHKDFSP